MPLNLNTQDGKGCLLQHGIPTTPRAPGLVQDGWAWAEALFAEGDVLSTLGAGQLHLGKPEMPFGDC